MKITAKEISDLIDGKLFASPEMVITGAAGLSEAGQSDVSFVANPKYISEASTTKAGLVIIPENVSLNGKSSIKVKNSQLAFAKVLNIFATDKSPDLSCGIHPSSTISPGAKLGKNVKVGPNVVIEDGAVVNDNTKILANCFIGRKTILGENCLIYPLVTIRENISIGKNVIIHSGTVIGADGFGFVPDTDKEILFKIPQIGIVEIGDNVEIGANVTIDRATTGKTKIGNGTKIDNLVMIAHNVQIGENCIIVAQAGIAGSTKIGDNVTIAAQSGIIGHTTIGDGAVIGAQAGVIGSVKPKEVVSGFPARPHKETMKAYAILNRLPKILKDLKKTKI